MFQSWGYVECPECGDTHETWNENGIIFLYCEDSGATWYIDPDTGEWEISENG